MSKEYLTVDIEEEIINYAWKKFLKSKLFPARLLYRKSKYRFDIRWAFFDFVNDVIDYNSEDALTEELPLDFDGKKRPKQILTTEYENKTRETQTYTFNVQGQKNDGTTFTFQTNYTIGGNISLDLGFSPHLKLSIGGKMEQQNTSATSNTSQNTMSWSTNTQFILQQGKRAKASINVQDCSKIVDFIVETTLLLKPEKAGRGVPVNIHHRASNTHVSTIEIMNLQEVFKKYKDSDLIKFIEKSIKFPDNSEIMYKLVKLKTKGRAKISATTNEKVMIETMDNN